ncbi:hypothetical protein LINPERHAP1_LOCUS5538 [Linum perenne]
MGQYVHGPRPIYNCRSKLQDTFLEASSVVIAPLRLSLPQPPLREPLRDGILDWRRRRRRIESSG